ncbi:hypothetical protein HDU81_003816 [Chytriomyces hyalinus]|nr:hypothetical protein HDU81_003816 [Chytriomyces hyalinus]
MQPFHISSDHQQTQTSLSEYLHVSETLLLPSLSPSQTTPQEMQLEPFSFTTSAPFLGTAPTPDAVVVEATAMPKKSLPQLLIKHAYKQPKNSVQQSPKSANSSSLHGFRRSSFKHQHQQAYILPAALQARIIHFQKLKEMQQQQQQMQLQQLPCHRALSVEIATTSAATTAACPKSAPIGTTTCTTRPRCYSLPNTFTSDPAFALLCSFSFDDASAAQKSNASSSAGVLQEAESLDQMRTQMSFIRGYIDQLKE